MLSGIKPTSLLGSIANLWYAGVLGPTTTGRVAQGDDGVVDADHPTTLLLMFRSYKESGLVVSVAKSMVSGPT